MRLQKMPSLGPVAGGVLVLSMRYGTWLVVLGVVAAIVVLLRREFHQRRRWLPALLAVRALSSPDGPSGGAKFEASAAELVVLARGRRDVLERAASLAYEETDLGRWTRSIDGITVAADLLDRGAVPGVTPRPRRTGRQFGTWVAATMASLIGAAMTSSEWWLVPLFVAYTGAVIAWADRREDHEWGPALVVATARVRQRADLAAPEELVAAQLAVLARGSVGPVRRARLLVEQWPGPVDDKVFGWRRLAMTAALLQTSGLAMATARRRAAMWVATGLITAVAWVATG